MQPVRLCTLDNGWQVNKVYAETRPWLESTDALSRGQVYAVSVETLRICGILLQPFIPTKSIELLEALGTKPGERSWDHAEPGKGTTGSLKQGVRLFNDPASARGTKLYLDPGLVKAALRKADTAQLSSPGEESSAKA